LSRNSGGVAAGDGGGELGGKGGNKRVVAAALIKWQQKEKQGLPSSAAKPWAAARLDRLRPKRVSQGLSVSTTPPLGRMLTCGGRHGQDAVQEQSHASDMTGLARDWD